MRNRSFRSPFQTRIMLHVYSVFAATLGLAFASANAAAATTFGPTQFSRGAGAPQTFTTSIPHCGGGACNLIIVNGAADGSNRVSSATVLLNGQQIAGPNNFSQRVARIVVPVTPGDSDQIQVSLKSAPGSYLTISMECASFAAVRIENSPGINSAIWANGTVSLSIPLANAGTGIATNVSITGVTAPGGSYVGPTPFAYSAGTLVPGQGQQLYAELSGVNGNAVFTLTISGTYNFGAALCNFQTQASVSPPTPNNGGTPKSVTSAQRFTVATAVYPAAPSPPAVGTKPNDDGVYLAPLGQPRYLFPAPPAASSLNRSLAIVPNDQQPASGSDPSAVVFVRNQTAGNYSNLPPDPSAAGADPSGFVLISANSAVSYSKDFGKTFTTVKLTYGTGFSDPALPSRTDFFPEIDGGLCCDQVVHYIPGRNLVVWLLQYWSPAVTVGGLAQKGQNRLRIAFATPQAAAADFLHAWSWFDVSPTTLGDTTVTDWMDYPDLAYSNGFLYIGVDHGFWNANLDPNGNVIGQRIYSDNRWMVRASLDDMANGQSGINLIYYEPHKGGMAKAHFAQSSPDTMYYAAQPDTSTLSVFADPDSSPNVPTPKDNPVTSRCQNIEKNPCVYTVNAPDNLDWNVGPHSVLGATYVAPSIFCPPTGCTGPTRFLYFAYDGGSDISVGRAYPYVRVEKVDADALNVVSETDIWNPGFAFATPALVWRPSSRNDEVAFSLATGGGGNYADNAVGFLGDSVAYLTTASNATQSDTSTPPVVRYGDYFSVRNSTGPVTLWGQGVGYSTLAYAVTRVSATQTCALGGCNLFLQYVMFGRKSELFPTQPPPVPR